MQFEVLPVGKKPPTESTNKAYLITDNWDDWFEFSTLYSLVFIDDQGNRHNLGGVKIGQFDMDKEQRRPNIPTFFEFLDEKFFSLGQDDSFYDQINNLGDDLRNTILSSLNDIALDEKLYDQAIGERVTRISLLRSVSHTSVKGQFRRLANGGVRLTQYAFSYRAPKIVNSDLAPVELEFNVEPESNPPTNIHVLIGRNGVGKTHLINSMINSLLNSNASVAKAGKFFSEHQGRSENLFANIVSVTFSAFDESEPLAERKDKSEGIQYTYVGLKRTRKSKEPNLAPKSPTLLKNEFVRSVQSCRIGSKTSRWKRALKILEADPIIKESEISSVIEIEEIDEFKEEAGLLFKKLSSGHKIVLLTITRLVEAVEERSLVLVDEPEAHLHPPLLAAFIRSLSDLLVQRNGVGIIATHSPVVLQEIPKSCVWKLRRTGSNAKVERLEIESFGENVGILTSEVFGLEVTHSGFHKMLSDSANKNDTLEEAIDEFDGQLGMEAKAILRGLFSTKKSQDHIE